MDLRDVTEFLKDASKYIVVILVVFLFAMYVASFHQVIGPSMNPTYTEGDVLLINKAAYKFKGVSRGDVIILKQDEKYMIKRVIALPRESVIYKDGKLYINGEEHLDEYASITDDFNINKLGVSEVGEDEYFVLGDNRGDSLDSRSYGLIEKGEIVGQVMFRLYPFK